MWNVIYKWFMFNNYPSSIMNGNSTQIRTVFSPLTTANFYISLDIDWFFISLNNQLFWLFPDSIFLFHLLQRLFSLFSPQNNYFFKTPNNHCFLFLLSLQLLSVSHQKNGYPSFFTSQRLFSHIFRNNRCTMSIFYLSSDCRVLFHYRQ